MKCDIQIIRAIALLSIGAGLPGLGVSPLPAIAQMQASEAASAEPTEIGVEVIDFTLVIAEEQPFDALMQEAAALAQDFVEQEFLKNPDAVAVVVNILGDRSGQILPLMSVRVPRTEWQPLARIEPWVTYEMGRPAMQLLGFLNRDATPGLEGGGFASSVAAPGPSTPPLNRSPSNFVPSGVVGPTEDYTLPQQSLEPTDPGYR